MVLHKGKRTKGTLMKVPEEIKAKILLAGEYYEKAWTTECEIREWLKQVGLAKDLEETPVEEALIDCTRLGDGSPKSFIALLENLEEKHINWEAKEPTAVCYFSIDENRDGEVWLECEGCLFRVDDSGADDVPSWGLAEFTRGERFRLGFSDLSWLEERECECWDADEMRDRMDCLTNEEAAEYHLSACSGKRLLPTEANAATPCGTYYFTL